MMAASMEEARAAVVTVGVGEVGGSIGLGPDGGDGHPHLRVGVELVDHVIEVADARADAVRRLGQVDRLHVAEPEEWGAHGGSVLGRGAGNGAVFHIMGFRLRRQSGPGSGLRRDTYSSKRFTYVQYLQATMSSNTTPRVVVCILASSRRPRGDRGFYFCGPEKRAKKAQHDLIVTLWHFAALLYLEAAAAS